MPLVPPLTSARRTAHVYVNAPLASMVQPFRISWPLPMRATLIRGWPWARLLFGAAVAGALVAVAVTLAGRDVPWWALAADAGALVAAVAGGVFLLGSGLFARPILAVAPARAGDRVAITFDDGPDVTHTPPLLDALERGGHRAAF